MRSPRFGRAFGWFLLAVPFVPLAWLFGELDRIRGLVPPSETLLGLFVFGSLAVLGARWFPARIPKRALHALDTEGGSGSRVAAGAVALLLGLLLATAVFAFSRRPLLIDSVIQWFQGRIFASGRLKRDTP